MASGTRAHGQNPPESELPPPPTMAEVLQNIENNRQRSERFLERLVQNTERRAEGVTLGDFIKAQPPYFAESKEPLDADDWLRTIERKLITLRVAERDRVNFATYKLEGPAGAWWEGF